MLETGYTPPATSAGGSETTKVASNSVKVGIRALQVKRANAVSLLWCFSWGSDPQALDFVSVQKTPVDRIDWFTSVHQRLTRNLSGKVLCVSWIHPHALPGSVATSHCS